MGDFNSNHTDYYNHLKDGLSTSKWDLLEFMDANALVDIHPSMDGKAPSTYEKRCAKTGIILQQTRIDGIWVSQDLITEIIHLEIWNTSNYHVSDHKMVLIYLSGDFFFHTLAYAKIKQRGELRVVYQMDKMCQEKWDIFSKL